MAKSSSHVVVETLNAAGMVRNRRLAKAHRGRWYGRLPVEAGVQVRLVRSRVRQGGPVVRLVEVVFSLRLEER